MSVCDFMLRKLWQEPKYFRDYATKLGELRAALPDSNSGWALRLSKAKPGQHAIHAIDHGKILLTAPNAEQVAGIFAEKYKIQMEMANGQYILAMTSVADSDEGFARLQMAVEAVNRVGDALARSTNSTHIFHQPDIVMSPKQAISSPTKLMPWHKAVGKISAQLVAKYPPGIAIIAPGERISKDIEPCQEHILVVG